MTPSETPIRKRVTRVRIVHPHDIFTGQIGYVVETIDQHSLFTYVVRFTNHDDRRAYQRNEIKFLSRVNAPKWLK